MRLLHAVRVAAFAICSLLAVQPAFAQLLAPPLDRLIAVGDLDADGVPDLIGEAVTRLNLQPTRRAVIAPAEATTERSCGATASAAARFPTARCRSQ